MSLSTNQLVKMHNTYYNEWRPKKY